MSIKKTLADQGMKLMSDPRVLQMMQDERFMKVMMAAMQLPGKVQTFTDEQKDAFTRMMGLATEDEVKNLKRTVLALEREVSELKKALAK
jgi:cell division FtsZ-interacting protein ZapD